MTDEPDQANPPDNPLIQRAEREIIELHQFFEDYYLGECSVDSITRFSGVLSRRFLIVDSLSTITNRSQIIESVRKNYAKRSNFRIWIKNVSLRYHHENLLIASYEEWQSFGDDTTIRYSTVVFLERSDMPNGLQWLHVRESGIQTISA